MRHPGRHRAFFPFAILAGVALLGFIVMQLWNWVMPAVTGVKSLSYPQALGLLILCRILFGSFRPSSGGFRRGRAWREKLKNMSEEDRARFREEWRNRRFGSRRPPSQN